MNPIGTLIQLLSSIEFLVVAIVAILFHARWRRGAFERKFPLISDEEFLARSSPGMKPEVALGVRRILSDALGVEYARVHPSSRLVGDLGAE